MDKKIIFCNCGGNLMKPQKKEDILQNLNREKISFIKINDLCSFCTTQPKDIQGLISGNEEVLVVACYPRAVKLLLNQIGIATDSGTFSFLNFPEMDNEEILSQVRTFADSGANISYPSEISANQQWQAWFPVIDYERCTACGQCADFCLFGVYEKKDQRVTVINPQACKNNCPACARICPHTAIVFPKYEHGGAIAGSDDINEKEEQERQRMDIDAILGSEIYQALEKRKLKRQSIIRNNAMEEAIKERDEALKNTG